MARKINLDFSELTATKVLIQNLRSTLKPSSSS